MQYRRKERWIQTLQKGGRHPYAQYPKDIRKIVVKATKRLKCGSTRRKIPAK